MRDPYLSSLYRRPAAVRAFAVLILMACEPAADDVAQVSSAPATEADSSFATVPDSAWIDVHGLTIIGFYPLVSNAQIDADPDLATVLDDFSYHLGTASDSLTAAGYTMQMQSGDTIWLRTPRRRWVIAPDPDSADVGYVLTDTLQQRAIVYGVRTYLDLIEYAAEFRRAGRVAPR